MNVDLGSRLPQVVTSTLLSIAVFAGGIVVHFLAPRLLCFLGAENLRVPGRPTMHDVRTVFSFSIGLLQDAHGKGAATFLRFAAAMLFASIPISIFYAIMTALNKSLGMAYGLSIFAGLKRQFDGNKWA